MEYIFGGVIWKAGIATVFPIPRNPNPPSVRPFHQAILSLSFSGLTVAIGGVNLIALKDAAPTLRQRASLVYCVAFGCLGVLYRAHDLLVPGIVLGVAAICYMTDAVRRVR